jgi:integrase
MGLGPLALVDLKEARDLALAARKQVHAGLNPIEERKAARAAAAGATFADVAAEVLAHAEAASKNDKHAAQWKLSLETHAKALREKPVSEITTEDVLEVLKPLWLETPETASRTRGRIERVLDAAKAKGLRTGENPARWRGHLALLLPARKRLTRGHHAAMPFKDVPDFMAKLKERPAPAARALELTILTAARTGEMIGATWGEFDLVGKVWTVPPARMKAGQEHRVALSDRAVEVLKGLADEKHRRPQTLVFPGERPGTTMSNMAMAMLMRRMGEKVFTVHGFRSSFRDWAGETTAFPREVVEAALAHTVGNAVERAYRRGDALEKRRKLMDAWAGYLSPKARR